MFHFFRVPKKFGSREGEYQDSPSKFFCLTVPRKFVGEAFSVSLSSGTEKIWIREGVGCIKSFRRTYFISQCRKRGNPLVFHLFRVSKKFG